MEAFIYRNFRTRHHFEWFRGSVAFFVIAGWFTFLGFSYVSYLFVCFHVLMFIIAIHDTKWGRVESYPFSPDCIWWNAFVAEMHGLVLLMNALSQTPA